MVTVNSKGECYYEGEAITTTNKRLNFYLTAPNANEALLKLDRHLSAKESAYGYTEPDGVSIVRVNSDKFGIHKSYIRI